MAVPFPAPDRFFASDNNASVHPSVLEAMSRVNNGHALAYGDDAVTHAAEKVFDEIFGRKVETFFVWNGTGANVMALASCLRPGGAVVCTQCAHINVDETGAPERFLGAKLIDVAHVSGRLQPDSLRALAHDLGVVHHVQPAVLSLTQSTEWGSVYSIEAIAELCDTAHSMGMFVHLDGARIANALVHLGGGIDTLRQMTVEAGVDVVSFGGTKNGLMYGEAVVYLDDGCAQFAPFLRKQVTQLPSKVRYIAAQFLSYFDGDLWLTNAEWANAKSLDLYNKVKEFSFIEVESPQVNSLYPVIANPLRDRLREWSFFYDWDPSRDQVRWMTAWDTTDQDIDTFVSGLRYLGS